MEIPPDIPAKGPKAVADFEYGAYLMMRVIAKKSIEGEYGLAAPSTLPAGDERGQGLLTASIGKSIGLPPIAHCRSTMKGGSFRQLPHQPH